MAKHNTDITPPEQTDEKEVFTKEDVQKIIAAERQKQFIADDTRIHGNAFFAEALDHISTLGARDPFWKRVYQFGEMFKHQFEINSGQAPQATPAPQQKAPVKEKPAAKEKPATTDTSDDTSSEYEQDG